MIINIIGGRGIMGQIHKKVFEAAGHEVIVSGRNSDPSPEQAAKNSDLTIVSVPIPATEQVIREIAPYCTAIMDFTSLKSFPINAMLKCSNPNCEIGGLHPLYGNVSSIKGETVIYCPTKRSGKKCEEIIKALKLAGAKIIVSSPEEHDKKIAITQNARKKLLEAYGAVIRSSGLNIEEAYKFAPPPTRIILDLLARQINDSNDEMYKAMENFNPNDKKIKELLISSLNNQGDPKDIRKLFGKELETAQKRAKKIIDANQ